VLVLGIADRVGGLSRIPDVLGRWDVLTVAFFLYAMEFVADKIPYSTRPGTSSRPRSGRRWGR
jgi:hypothetical protein